MGLDMYTRTQVRTDGKWSTLAHDRAPADRVYDLFQRIAGVCPQRRPDITPLFAHRGLADVPWNDQPSGDFGQTWATLAELRAVEDWPDSSYPGDQLRCEFLLWLRGPVADRLAHDHGGAENVRLLFAFN